MKKSYSRIFSMLALTLCATPALATPPAPAALPTGGQVTAGQAAISQSGSAMTINQTSDKAILNWQSFNIGSQAAVRFSQPSASAVALNRVLAGEASQIYGHLTANGQVYLVNPAGIVFGPGSRVDVGGLVVSTLDITDADFLAGKRSFSRNNATGSITNQGEITAADGGLVALLAPTVVNEGVISARLGNVALAAGDKITLAAGADGLLQLAIDPATLQTLIDNRQLIVADGGQVLMTSKAADALAAGVVANSGTIQARTLQEHEGRILLLADMEHGEINLSGNLDASAPSSPLPLAGEGAGERANGGFVETSAAHVKVADTARVTTLAANGANGTWLIDPNDYTIAASGGNISGATLSANLAGGNVAINTATQGTAGGNGDIFVNDAVSWNANTLTLTAERDININAVMTASGASILVMNPTGTVKVGFAPGEANGFAGRVDFPGRSGAGFLTIKGVGYTVINSLGVAGSVTGTDLQGMSGNLAGKYALGANIDASATSTWNAGAGFAPMGVDVWNDPTVSFTGIFDGLGHVISGLTIDRPATNFVGLFGAVEVNGVVRNVGSQGGTIGGEIYVGGLVGWNDGTVINSYATGSVVGTIMTSNLVGGLVGYNAWGTISNAYATGDVTGQNGVGGLVGLNQTTISNVYAAGNIIGNVDVGGLVGSNGGAISNAHASGDVTGSDTVGGLVGESGNGAISNSYATGNVTSVAGRIGGLVGLNWGTPISNSYATGSVTTGNCTAAGGLVGDNDSAISNSYATGHVTATAGWIGGLVGTDSSTQSVANYWNTETTGQAASALGTGLTTAQMKQQASFAGWDISATGGEATVWRIYEGQTAPLLRDFLTPLTVTANNASKTYDGLAYSSATAYTTSAAADASKIFGTVASSGLNVGSHAITPASLYSNQQGYDLIFANGALTINPASLTITASNDSKAYDGNGYSGGNGVGYSGFVNGETAAVLGGVLAYGGSSQGAINAGGYAITPSGRTAANYTITFVNGVLTITGAAAPAPTPAPVADPDESAPDGGLLWRNTHAEAMMGPVGQPISDQPASPSATPTIELAQLHGSMENRLLSILPNFIRLQEE